MFTTYKSDHEGESAVSYRWIFVCVGKDKITMLLPPGIRNDGNICFASSILQCLFNCPLFQKMIIDVGVSHTPTCKCCKEGKLY